MRAWSASVRFCRPRLATFQVATNNRLERLAGIWRPGLFLRQSRRAAISTAGS